MSFNTRAVSAMPDFRSTFREEFAGLRGQGCMRLHDRIVLALAVGVVLDSLGCRQEHDLELLEELRVPGDLCTGLNVALEGGGLLRLGGLLCCVFNPYVGVVPVTGATVGSAFIRGCHVS